MTLMNLRKNGINDRSNSDERDSVNEQSQTIIQGQNESNKISTVIQYCTFFTFESKYSESILILYPIFLFL